MKLFGWIFVIALFVGFTTLISSEGSAQKKFFVSGFDRLEKNPKLDLLAPEVLAFPDFTESYRLKVIEGNFEIWSENRLQRWASAQGLRVTGDHYGGGLQFKRAAVIGAPGLSFTLTRPVTEKGSAFQAGWRLVLDIAAIRNKNQQKPKGEKRIYDNVLEFDLIIDAVHYQTVTQGAGKEVQSPIVVEIPYIRDETGVVTIELKMANHPRNFIFLYDAYLTR